MSDRTGTTTFLTIDAQDPIASGHDQYLSLSAPIVRAGEATTLTYVNGKQVALRAGGVDALVLTNAVGICAAVTFGTTNHPDNQVACLAVKIKPTDTLSACVHTAANGVSGVPESCKVAAWADMAVEMVSPVVFSSATIFNGAIQMAKGTENVEFKASTVTLSNPSACTASDEVACAALTLNNNEATCTTGAPAHGLDCAYTARVLDSNGAETTAEACHGAQQATCVAVDTTDGIPATCTDVSGCMYTTPIGTVAVKSEKTRIQGQDVFIQGKCTDDPSTLVGPSATFTFYVSTAHLGTRNAFVFSSLCCVVVDHIYVRALYSCRPRIARAQHLGKTIGISTSG